MPKMNTIRFRNCRQTGIALVASLVIMMILTILGVTVMNMTSLEEKMAFNTQDRYLARYLAESSVLYMAVENLLPPPDDPGVSLSTFTLSSAQLGPNLESATGQITFVQSAPLANMPIANTTARLFSSGSGDDNPYIYQIYVEANTVAGTSARMRGAYYRLPPQNN